MEVICWLQAGVGHLIKLMQHSWQKMWPLGQNASGFLTIPFFVRNSWKQELQEKSPLAGGEPLLTEKKIKVKFKDCFSLLAEFPITKQ